MLQQPSSPISKLNADILVDLFTLIANTDPPAYLQDYSSPFWDPRQLQMGWTRLSHVCSLWREITICELPFLWAQIVLAFPHEGAYTTILNRAQDCPIVLRLHRSIETSAMRAPTVNLVRAHWGRARVLDLPTLDPPEDWSDLFNSRVLPQLRELYLSGFYHRSHPDFPVLHIQAPDLLSARIDMLHGPTIVLHSPLLVRLGIFLSDSFTTRHLLETLGGTPCLEYLQVHTSRALDWPRLHDTHLSLPRLTELRIDGSIRHCIPFIRIVSRTSHIRQLYVEGYGRVEAAELEEHGDAEAAELKEALDVTLPGLARVEARLNSLFIHIGRFQICAYNSQECNPDTHSNFLPPGRSVWFYAPLFSMAHCEPSMTSHFMNLSRYSKAHGEPVQLASRFCARLRTVDIEHLMIQWGIPESSDTELWTSLSSVTSITLVVKASLKEPAATRSIDLLRGPPASRTLLFPRLHTLKLCACQYNTVGDMDERSGWWSHVIDVLMSRCQHDAPVRRLIVCDIYRECDARDPRIRADEEGIMRAAALVEELIDQRKWMPEP